MFSQLGPLFKTTFRQAESADARLEIRREEKEDGRKKQGEEAQEETSSSLWEDSTEVSIESLRTFLIEFLKGQGAPAPENAADTVATPAPQAEQKPPISTAAMRAAKAYGSMAAQVHPAPPPALETPPPTETTDLASLLAADEIRAIHALIAELDALSRTGFQTLNFQMNGTFVESLAEAVRLAKNPA